MSPPENPSAAPDPAGDEAPKKLPSPSPSSASSAPSTPSALTPSTPPSPSVPVHSPLLRNGVHLAVFLLIAIPLGAIADPRTGPANGRTIAALILFLIAVFNLAILPRLHTGKQLARPDDGAFNGLWLYPFTLSICFLIYPAYAAVGAWAALAAGDAAASFVGRHVASPKLPWNAKKSWAGLAGFILAAVPLCYAALYIIPCPLFLRAAGPPELPYVWTLAVLAAVAGALVESLPVDLDDNVRVPLATGAVLWVSAIFLSFATRRLPADTHVQPEQFLTALLVNALIAGAALLLKFSNVPGALLGGALGAVIYLFAQWQGYALFLLFAFGGSILSKVGLAKKQAIGAAEPREGRRGAANVAANLLVPGLCCLAYPIYGGHGAFLMAFAGALAAAFADTASSEIGALSGAQPKLITSLKPVPHGTNGAVSALGLAAAFAACALIAALAAYTDFYALLLTHKSTPPLQRALLSCVLVIAGLTGTLVDSLLGATVEDRFPGIGKGAVNFACTLTGAVMAGLGFIALV